MENCVRSLLSGLQQPVPCRDVGKTQGLQGLQQAIDMLISIQESTCIGATGFGYGSPSDNAQIPQWQPGNSPRNQLPID